MFINVTEENGDTYYLNLNAILTIKSFHNLAVRGLEVIKITGEEFIIPCSMEEAQRILAALPRI